MIFISIRDEKNQENKKEKGKRHIAWCYYAELVDFEYDIVLVLGTEADMTVEQSQAFFSRRI